jgi:hypothetical protein
MPLGWTRGDEFGILTVVGEGDISRQDIENYLQATMQEGTKAHAKIVDITAGNLALDRDDLESVAQTLLEYGSGGGAGPVGMVVRGALNIDMAVLLKQRVGQRPFRIFTDPLEARSWLLMPRPVPATPERAERVLYQVANAAR